MARSPVTWFHPKNLPGRIGTPRSGLDLVDRFNWLMPPGMAPNNPLYTRRILDSASLWRPSEFHRGFILQTTLSNLLHTCSEHTSPPPFSSETFCFIQMFLSLTTKLIESSTIAHSDEEEERNDTHWRLGLTAISLNGLWATVTLTAS